MNITLRNKDIVAARLIVKTMKARGVRPKNETLLIANSLPGTVITV